MVWNTEWFQFQCQLVMCIIHTMDSREVIRPLREKGWILHHTKGDHHQFKHSAIPGKVTIPHPKKDLPIGTLRSIYRQAGWEWR